MQKVVSFEKEILLWYAKNGRKHLPWRKNNISPYEVWISEVMLQQTQVSRVIDYYNRFLERFPTVFDLAKATWEEFYPYYAGLGYYNRGRNMLKTARIVVEKFRGIFPEEKEHLLKLPGVGDYTASAILSFGYNKNEIAFDTNVKKVFGRVFLGSKNASLKYIKEKIYEITEQQNSKRDLNAALMDFSNTICLKIPRCGECPLQNWCEYYKTDGMGEEKKPAQGWSDLGGKKQKTNRFDSQNAKVILYLHKDHKEYFSLNKAKYSPFILSKKYNTRETIKKYFLEKYNLHLSVRPPHERLYKNGVPYIKVNAQILVGQNSFYSFSKKYFKLYE